MDTYLKLSSALNKLLSLPKSYWNSYSSLVTNKTLQEPLTPGLSVLLHYLLKSLETSSLQIDQTETFIKIKANCLLAITHLKNTKQLMKDVEMQYEYIELIEGVLSESQKGDNSKKFKELFDYRGFAYRWKDRMVNLNKLQSAL